MKKGRLSKQNLAESYIDVEFEIVTVQTFKTVQEFVKSGSPYTVRSNMTVPAGELMIIRPGVKVYFAENVHIEVLGESFIFNYFIFLKNFFSAINNFQKSTIIIYVGKEAFEKFLILEQSLLRYFIQQRTFHLTFTVSQHYWGYNTLYHVNILRYRSENFFDCKLEGSLSVLGTEASPVYLLPEGRHWAGILIQSSNG